MMNNDVLRSIRHMLKMSELKMTDLVKYSGGDVTLEEIHAYLKKEDEPGFRECPQNTMAHFLNGLIYFMRGKDENRAPLAVDLPTNNVVLKKLRVALEMRDEDIIAVLNDAGFRATKSEISALFRKEGHPNYRVCGDQLLRNFLKGLTMNLRGTKPT